MNLFSIRPNPQLVGVEEERNKLVSYIQNGNICFLNGPPGTGKSSTLEWIKKEIKGHTIIYLDAKTANEYFDVKSHIKKHAGVVRKLLRKYPKNAVFLLDEAQAANHDLISELEVLWNSKIIKSIVVTQIKPHLPNCPDSFIDRLGKRTVRLNALNLIKVYEMIKLRTNNKHPFSDDAIKVIAEKANFIPRKVLENCEVVLVESGNKDKIEATDVKFILGGKEDEELELGAMELEETMPDESKLIPLESVDKMEGVSPMEIRIIKLLLENGKTAIQLATILNTGVGSVGKQLSKLMKTNVVEVANTRRPKMYGLSREFKQKLMANEAK
jgi:DNA-binding CsgD family transcriptional regulator